jgi:hypothetical protein
MTQVRTKHQDWLFSLLHVPLQLSGLSYSEYLRVHILEPAGLNNTHYYIDNGYGEIRPGLVELPSYGSLFRPLDPPQQLKVSYTIDQQNSDAQNATELMSKPYGQFVKVNRLVNFLGEAALANTAGDDHHNI